MFYLQKKINQNINTYSHNPISISKVKLGLGISRLCLAPSAVDQGVALGAEAPETFASVLTFLVAVAPLLTLIQI